MKEITVLSESKRGFTVSNGDDQWRLEYPGWLSQKANIMIDDDLYTVEPKGIFSASFEVKKDGRIVLILKMNWKGQTRITGPVENGHYWMFKHHGFLTSRFALTDEKGNKLLQLNSAFKWSKFNADYTISTSDSFSYEDNELLIMVSVYCSNYYASLQMSGMQ